MANAGFIHFPVDHSKSNGCGGSETIGVPLNFLAPFDLYDAMAEHKSKKCRTGEMPAKTI